LLDKANAAIAEEEVAATRMETAEPADGVVRSRLRAAVRAALAVLDRRQDERSIHRLIERRIVAAAQSGDAKSRPIEKTRRMQDGRLQRPGSPALVDLGRLAREKI